MSDRIEERIDELIALAALGELTESDDVELDALLADDVELSSEVDGALEAAAALHAVVSEAAPEHLRASVLDAIAATPQAPADSSWVDQPPAAPAVPAPVIDLAEQRRRRRWIPALSAAAAMILLAGVGIVFVRGDSVSDENRLMAQVETVVSADDAIARSLEGSLDGTVTVVYSPDEEAIVIDGDGLPVLGDDRAFVLWFVSDDGATPIQTFRPDASGDVLVRVDGVDPTGFMIGITEEDAGGAEMPTTPILASA
ncbi:MAG: anti-sigma factor [Ilumatobacter sp.]|uniref:anti-sigma factor n=1 Tax=Ilumatobacter sp. TaxID=1967498 RepID=UPI003C748B96